MDENLIRRIRVAARSLDAPERRLLDLLAELTASGKTPDVQIPNAIAIDRDELAGLLLAVARSPSLGDALLAEGFRPATGAKIAPRRIHPRIPYAVKRYPPKQTEGSS